MRHNRNTIEQLLNNPNFILFAASDFIGSFGNILTLFAIWLQVMIVTGNSPAALGLLSIAFGTSLATVIGPRAVFLIAGGLEFGAVVISRLLPGYRQVRESLAERLAV